MPWFKVDDSLPDHADVIELLERRGGMSAIGLWTLSGAWSSRQLTDGFVSNAVLKRLGGTQKQAAMLVEVGLWERADGGYQFRNWLKYQPSKGDVQAERAKARERMKRKRSGERSGEHPENFGSSSPSPTRPDPTRPECVAREVSPLGWVETAATVYAEEWSPGALRADHQHTPKQRDALVHLAAWSGCDEGKLRDGLRRLRKSADEWLLKQPIHVVAERIGTGPAPIEDEQRAALLKLAREQREQVIIDA